MAELENPKTWTKSYVISHRAECLLFLREMNLAAVNYIEKGKFFGAAVSLNDVILNGLMVMKSSGKYGDLRSYLAGYSCVCGEIYGFADTDMMLREARELGINPQHTLAQTKKNLRDNATDAFLDALDFSTNDRMKDCITAILKDLADGVPANQIQRDYASDFPQDVQDILLDMDSRFFVPELLRCAPDRCVHLDRKRLIFTRELETGGVPSQFGPVTDRPSGKKRGKKKGPSFDEWMEINGWDEEDLEWACRRVKRRRNIYGILLLIPPLGILLLPFWLRAVWLTRALRNRDIDVGFRFPEYVVLFVLGLPTCYIYPIVIGWIIRWSNWGMGLGDPRGAVLNTLFWGAILLLLLRQVASSIGPIPFAVCAVLLVVFLVIRLCRRLGSPVPALVFGGLSVVALVTFLAFFRTPVSMESKGVDLPGWLSSLSGKVLGARGGTESESPDQAAMAQAMLDVLDRAVAEDEYGGAALADADGDNVKELLLTYGGYATLYSWRDGQLTEKEVGALAGGGFSWYLCQDTETGERGIVFTYYDGGGASGASYEYYYPSRDVLRMGGYAEYDEMDGTLLGEFYYIGDYVHQVTKEEYQAARDRNQILEEVLNESDWDGQTIITRAELEVMRDGGTLQDISDDGLLALAQIAIDELPGMYFSLDTGAFIPQDRDDYIVVNVDWYEGEYEIRAYRVLDCSSAAEVETLVQDKWHQKVSRRYPIDYEAHVIEYSGQAGVYNCGDLLQQDGALYAVENWGLGDGGFTYTVDQMISRTADEAVFQAHEDNSDDFYEITINLIYEDGVWKYGEMR